MLTITSQFTTPGGAVGIGYDDLTGEILVYNGSGLVTRFSSTGVNLGSFANAGESANDYDLDFASTPFTLGGVDVPAGTAIQINGESGVAEIYAVNPQTGAVIATLVTQFGDSHVVGGSYHPERGTFFLVQDRVPSTERSTVAEIDPATGAVLNTFTVDGNGFTINYGDLDVDPVTGDLLLVSSDETSVLRISPDGVEIEQIPLPSVGGLSGIAVVPGTGQVYVVNTSGTVYLLDGLYDGITITGTATHDVLEGTLGSDAIYGLAGNDRIRGLGGNDIIEGGAGNDSLDGGTGIDTASYAGAAARVTVNLNLTSAQSTISQGIDTLTGFENVIGSAFNDTLTGGADANRIEGGLGNDIINGLAGNDVLIGGDGNDALSGGVGNDGLDGGAGIDIASYAEAAAGVTVSLLTTSAQNTGGGGIDTLTGIEGLVGSAFDDLLIGNAGDNSLAGGAGNDVIRGDLGNDTIDGGFGNDTLDYSLVGSAVTVNLISQSVQNTLGAGLDRIRNIENLTGTAFNDVLNGNEFGNILRGGAGNDALTGNAGNDTLDGGDGIDTASYAAAATGVRVNLTFATAQSTVGAGTDTLIGIENVIGSAHDDQLTGDVGDNLLTGNAGNDLLQGGLGNDTLLGGAGVDTASYATATTGVTVSLLDAAAQNTGGAGIDTLSSIENLIGSNHADTLTGNATGNSISGGSGEDVIDGGSGNDTLDGGNGNDILIGANGDDILIGGAGRDTLTGGAGNDSFVYQSIVQSPASANADRITDFTLGDILDLSAVDADSVTVGDQGFTQVAAFTGTAAQLTLAFDAGTNTTTLRGDTDGNGVADFSILFTGDVTALTGTWVL
ncbi:Ca2+-binding RTX toxin-like protein [Sphingomonas zeicaulis]|uniref:beta strand repeat-containing protein n=1 Tax=Sphingomonas zeicaulis TaxID=1632740 RepID=UPI003D213B33